MRKSDRFKYDPSLVFYVDFAKHDGAKFMSDDAYGRLCTVTNPPIWSPNGGEIGVTSEIETPALGLSDSVNYTIIEWFEGHFRCIVNDVVGGKSYYVDGVSSSAFTPTYSLTTNKILAAVA